MPIRAGMKDIGYEHLPDPPVMEVPVLPRHCLDLPRKLLQHCIIIFSVITSDPAHLVGDIQPVSQPKTTEIQRT